MKGHSFSSVIHNTFWELGKAYSEVFGATMLTLISILGLCLFPVFGFFMAFFALGFLCVGQKFFIINLITGKKPDIEKVFSFYKKAISCFCLKTLVIVFSLLLSLVFIIPGIVACLDYSFASFVKADNPDLSTIECLRRSRKLVHGHRFKLFVLFMIMLIFCLVGGLVGYGLSVVIANFVTLQLWATIAITLVSAFAVDLLIAFPFYEIAYAFVYIEAKNIEKEELKSKNNLTLHTVKR